MYASRPASLALILGLVSGCTSASHLRSHTESARRAPTAGYEARVITREELTSMDVGTLYQAVERLRPEFLHSRNPSPSPMHPSLAIVYLDGKRLGGPDALATLTVGDIYEVRYISANDADVRFGYGHNAGAILVTSLGRSRP
jgi:hypothetical protein